MKYGYRVAAIAPVDKEIGEVCSDHRMAGVEFAQTDQAQIGEIRIAVPIPLGQFGNPRQVIGKTERKLNQACAHQIENQN